MAPTYETAGTYGQSSGGVPQATVSCGAPSGAVADDIIELHLYYDPYDAGITPPSGFTEADASPTQIPTSGPQTMRVYWKRSTGSEPGSYVTSFTPNVYAECVALRFSGCATSGVPYDTPGASATATGVTSSPAVSMTTLGADRLLVHMASNWNGGTWTDPSGFTRRGTPGGFNTFLVSTKAQAVAGSTGTVQATNASNASMAAWLGALKGPAAASWVYGVEVRVGI